MNINMIFDEPSCREPFRLVHHSNEFRSKDFSPVKRNAMIKSENEEIDTSHELNSMESSKDEEDLIIVEENSSVQQDETSQDNIHISLDDIHISHWDVYLLPGEKLFPCYTHRAVIRRSSHLIPWGIRLEVFDLEDVAKLSINTNCPTDTSQVEGIENVHDGDELVAIRVIFENDSYTVYKGKIEDRSWGDLTLGVLKACSELELYLFR